MKEENEINNDSITNRTSTVNAEIPKSNINTKRKKVKMQVKSLGNPILFEHETIIYMILSTVNHGEWIKYFVLQKKFVLALLSINSIGIIVTTIFDTLRVFVVIPD